MHYKNNNRKPISDDQKRQANKDRNKHHHQVTLGGDFICFIYFRPLINICLITLATNNTHSLTEPKLQILKMF